MQLPTKKFWFCVFLCFFFLRLFLFSRVYCVVCFQNCAVPMFVFACGSAFMCLRGCVCVCLCFCVFLFVFFCVCVCHFALVFLFCLFQKSWCDNCVCFFFCGCVFLCLRVCVFFVCVFCVVKIAWCERWCERCLAKGCGAGCQNCLLQVLLGVTIVRCRRCLVVV